VEEVATVNVELATPFTAGVTDTGANAQVTVAGAPGQLKATEELKLFSDVIFTRVVLLFPTTVVTEAAERPMEKSGGGFRLSVNTALRVCELLTPLTVTVYAAAGAVDNVVTVRVDVVDPPAGGVTAAGETPQVTVGVTGDTAQARVTAELKLLSELTVTVDDVLLPATVVTDTGATDRLKSLMFKV
jgi:hypothetical protein